MKTAENMALPENKWEGFPLSFQQKQLIKQNTRNSPQYFSAKYSLSGALGHSTFNRGSICINS